MQLSSLLPEDYLFQDLRKETKGDPKNRWFGNQRSTVETGFLATPLRNSCLFQDLRKHQSFSNRLLQKLLWGGQNACP
ncbi:hypothetical protein [Microseira wollei]|uniref:Transposase n=1 Tax=Microseira wollei NIES-4236 TaxID=2530354 RepID=A0AAV3XHH3_9CYAN|nr:hypothetical protein [Microseira wollei]GET42053.1 hypothetical protein MiSe_68670 [Microseira wollei NIES-4236]